MKPILITGAGSGLGKALTIRYADAGYRVFAVELNQERLNTLNHQNIIPVQMDISDAKMWEEVAVAAIEKNGGKLDCAIACAALLKVGSVEECSVEDWNLQNNINLTGQFLTAKTVLKYLKESKGNIIFIGSPSAKLAVRNEVCYITFKHAILGLSKSIAFDYSALGVRSNVVHPGWIRTAMSDKEMEEIMERDSVSLEEAYNTATRFVPMQRPAALDEVINAIMYLTSEQASYITGTELTVDGGLSIVDSGMIGFL